MSRILRGIGAHFRRRNYSFRWREFTSKKLSMYITFMIIPRYFLYVEETNIPRE